MLRRYPRSCICSRLIHTDWLSYLASPMIKVIVGGGDHANESSENHAREGEGENDADADDPLQSFFVHKDLVTSRSEFFAKALRTASDGGSGTWLEGDEGVVRLPDDDPKVFANYLQLLYHNAVPDVNNPILEAPTTSESDDQA
jgi:hypothetical protein